MPPAKTAMVDRRLSWEPPMALHLRLLKFLSGYAGLFVVVSVISLIGAMLFIEIESGENERRRLLKQNAAMDIEDGMAYLVKYWWHFAAEGNLTFVQWNRTVMSGLRMMNHYVVEAVGEHDYDGTVKGWVNDWTLPRALLFTITIMTTVGYGNVYPRTPHGQFFTIIFALVGTPAMLLFLASVGDSMASSLVIGYSRLCCRWCRSVRYQSERRPGKRAKRLIEDKIGQEPYMPTDEVQVPIIISLLLIIVYLGLGACIFSSWEDWEFSGAYYFSFVTLSTIGFGDMVPGNSFLGKRDVTFWASVKIGVTILYCIVGMALISMCIQVMQDSIVSSVRWMAREAGIIPDKDSRPRARIRRSAPGTVPDTYDLEDSRRPTTTDRWGSEWW